LVEQCIEAIEKHRDEDTQDDNPEGDDKDGTGEGGSTVNYDDGSAAADDGTVVVQDGNDTEEQNEPGSTGTLVISRNKDGKKSGVAKSAAPAYMKQFTTKRKTTLQDTHANASGGTLKLEAAKGGTGGGSVAGADVHHPESYPYYRLNQEPENIFELSQTLPTPTSQSSSEPLTQAQQLRSRAQTLLGVIKAARDHELETVAAYYNARMERLQQFIANPSSSNSSVSSPPSSSSSKSSDRKGDEATRQGEQQRSSSSSLDGDGTVIFGSGITLMPSSASTAAAHFAAVFPGSQESSSIPVHVLAASAIVFPSL